MTDPHLPALAEVRSAGLRPRRLRWAAVLVRALAWPVLRGWFYATVRRSEGLARALEQEVGRLRREVEAHTATTVALRHQVETLQAALATFTVDRTFFEHTIRTELMAVTNVVDCYRDVVEQELGSGSGSAPSAPHAARARATRVYVHGNCQATAVAGMLREARPDWQVDSFEVFGDRIAEQGEHYRKLVAEADIILSQPVARDYRGRDDLSVEWLRSASRPGCTVATFPSMYFDGQLLGQHSLGFAGVTSGYHDVVLAACAAAGMGAEEAVTLLLAEDRYSRDFQRAEYELSVAELRGREEAEGIDVRLTPFLMAHPEDGQLFHAANHPHRAVLAWMTNGLLDRLAAGARIAEEGCNPLPVPHFPLLPSVARFLRTGWSADPRWAIPYPDCYRMPDLLTREEGLRREYAFYRGMDQAELAAALRPPRVQRFLGDAAKAGQIPHGLASVCSPPEPKA